MAVMVTFLKDRIYLKLWLKIRLGIIKFDM